MGVGSFSKNIIDVSTQYYDYNIINNAYNKILKDYNNKNSNIATLHSILLGIPIIFGLKNKISIIIAYKYYHKLDNKWIYSQYENDENNTSYYVNKNDFILVLRMAFIINHIFDIVPEIINNINDLLDQGKPLLISKESWLSKVSNTHNYDFDKVAIIQGYNNLVKFDVLCDYLATTLLPNVNIINDNSNNNQLKDVVQDIVDTSINDAIYNLIHKRDNRNIKKLLKNLTLTEVELLNKHIDSEVLSARRIEKRIIESQSAPNTMRK